MRESIVGPSEKVSYPPAPNASMYGLRNSNNVAEFFECRIVYLRILIFAHIKFE